MQVIPVLFKRILHNNVKYIYNEIQEGCEWALLKKNIATVKLDGYPCLIKQGVLYKRHLRKLIKSLTFNLRRVKISIPVLTSVPHGWVPIGCGPVASTGYWPGWLPVQKKSDDKIYLDAYKQSSFDDGTYELVGPDICNNPYQLQSVQLIAHMEQVIENPPADFENIRLWLATNEVEGIVWHHQNGQKVKIRRKDFGFEWPLGLHHYNRKAIDLLKL